ncbi:MAG: hypothetical protein ACLFVJ_22715 [Persicimonas sp.]
MAALLLVLALAPAQTAAEEEADEAPEALFRKWVVGEMDWRPGHGVSLTTVDFARKHARSYPEKSDERRGGFGVSCPQPHELADTEGLVLFQTEQVDIFVHASHLLPEGRSGEANVCIFQRGRPTGQGIGCVPGMLRGRDPKVKFVEATGAYPLELKVHASGGCGTNCGVEFIKIYALDAYEPNPILERAFGRDYLPSIPNANYWNLKITHMPDGPNDSLVIRYHPMLLINGIWLPPPSPFEADEPTEPRRPLIRERCQRENVGEKMSCEKEVIEKTTLDDTEPFLHGRTWRQNARAITYFIEHQDELRERGFVIEKEFIERLRRHLPESMQRKYE